MVNKELKYVWSKENRRETLNKFLTRLTAKNNLHRQGFVQSRVKRLA